MGSVGIRGGNAANILDKFSMKGKTVVITGGARGLGLNFANGLAQAGANIAAIDIHEKPHDDFAVLTSYGVKAKYYMSDVQDYDKLKKTIDTIANDFGSIDGCIPAAGIIRDKHFLEHTPQDTIDTMNVNVNGVFSTIQCCANHMKAQGTGGTIVCISSTAGHWSLAPQGIGAYAASKWAVRGLAKQVAGELAEFKIRCNSISPGPVRTDMLEKVMQERPKLRQQLLDSCMMKRLAEPDELNGAMLFLMSDASSYVTGNDILVDGGLA